MFRGPASGLWTSPNVFSEAPAGSLKVASNLVFAAPSVIEPRRGFDLLAGGSFGSAASLADAMAFYGSTLLVAYDLTQIAIRETTGPSADTFVDWYSQFVPVGANRMRFETAARSIYFNPGDGIRVWDGVGDRPVQTLPAATAFTFDYDGGSGTQLAGDSIHDDTFGNTLVTQNDLSGVTNTIWALTADGGGPYYEWSNNDVLDGSSLVAAINEPGGTAAQALIVSDQATVWIVGGYVYGETSGAHATITVKTAPGVLVSPARFGLRLEDVVGTFTDGEEVSFRSAIPTPQPQFAGCPQGLSIGVVPLSTNGWQSPDTAVAYRFTICRKDAFERIIEGPPSGATIGLNLIRAAVGQMVRAATTVTVTLLVEHNLAVSDSLVLAPGETSFPVGVTAKTVATVPNAFSFTYTEAGPAASNTLVQDFEITRSNQVSCNLPVQSSNPPTTDNFLRIYRSDQTLTAADTPGEDMRLCYESAYLTAAEITSETYTFEDVAPDSFLGDPLYTSPNIGSGALAANFEPPVALDLAYWQDAMWYANTRVRHFAQLSLIGIGSPDGIQHLDTITVVPDDPAQTTFTYTARDGSLVGPTDFNYFEDYDPRVNIEKTALSLCAVINATAGSPITAQYISGAADDVPGKMIFVANGFTSVGGTGSFKIYSSRPTCWTPQLPDFTTRAWPALASSDNAHAARVMRSKLGNPDAVPIVSFIDINDDEYPILRIFPTKYRLLVFKTDGIYAIPTGLPLSYQRISDYVLLAPDSLARAGDVVYALTDQGVVEIDDGGVNQISIPVEDAISRLESSSSVAALRTKTFGMTYRTSEQYLLWALERDDAGAISADNAQTFCYSLRAKGFTNWDFGARCAAIDAATDQLLVAPTDDNALWLERKSLTDADYADVGDVAISCRLVFNDFTAAEPATMKMAQQVSFLFARNGMDVVTATFASEVHPARVEVALNQAGWGEFSWGEEPWGNPPRRIRRVQPLPNEVANCCQLEVGFSTSQVAKKFSFQGIDVQSDGDTIANRG